MKIGLGEERFMDPAKVKLRQQIETIAIAMNAVGYEVTGQPAKPWAEESIPTKDVMMRMAKVAMEKTRQLDQE